MAGGRNVLSSSPFRASQLSLPHSHLSRDLTPFPPIPSLSRTSPLTTQLVTCFLASTTIYSTKVDFTSPATRKRIEGKYKFGMSHSRNISRARSESVNITPAQRSRTRRSGNGDLTEDQDFFRTRSAVQASVSTRSADLSQRVNKMEEGISTIKDQLRHLVDHRHPHSTTSTPHQTREPVHIPPTRYLDFEQELRWADPPFDTYKGKDVVRDFFVNNPIPRPYMFLQGPGFHNAKDKVAHRDKMTFNEYVLAFTTMLKDKRACTHEDWPHLIEHLNQVVADAQTRRWENVRAWSDHIFTRIEGGDIQWSSKDEIQFDRMRLSLAPANNPTQLSADQQPIRQVVCSDFNARRCKHRENHTEAGITFIHACAWCHAALGNRNPHTVVKCENKLRLMDARNHQYQPQAHNQQGSLPRQQAYQQPQQPTYQSTQQPQQPRRQVFTSALIQNTQPPTKSKNEM